MVLSLTLTTAIAEAGGIISKGIHQGETQLVHAAKGGDLDEVQRLLSIGVNANAKHNGWTPLLWAVRNGDIDITELLLNNNADANILIETIIGRDSNYMTRFKRAALCEAVQFNNIEIVKLLLKHGADVNAMATYTKSGTKRMYKTLKTPLHIAARFGHTEIVRLLLDRGAKIIQADGITPIHEASKKNRYETLLLLTQVMIAQGDGSIAPENGNKGE